MRRAVFQVHLWVGIAAGLYVCIVCLTGAALVFRIDMHLLGGRTGRMLNGIGAGRPRMAS